MNIHFKKTSLLAVVLLGFSALFAHAQEVFSDKTITGVDININGPKSVSENRLRNFMSVKPGQKFSYDKLDDDVKRLYESGLVDDVTFLAEPNAEGIKIVAEVVTRPSLEAIAYEGNTIFSDKKLRTETEMVSGGALNDTEILRGKRNIEKLYLEKGFPDTSVTYRIDDGDNGFSNLVFIINEGIKGEVDEITFVGNNAFSGVELEREMETKEKGVFSFLTKSGQIDNSVLQQDIQNIINFYQNEGYLRVDIPEIDRIPAKKEGMVDLVIQINEGNLYTVSGVGFKGLKVFTTDEIWKALTLLEGDAYSAEKMQDDIKLIRSYYGSKGYADARVKPVLKNTASDGVYITYEITEGSRFRVGSVNIQGNNTTKDNVIRREVPLTPGEWFNSVDLETTKNRLRNLNYFNNVQTTANNSSRSGYRDVDIQVDEKRTGSLGFGAGFSSIDSIVGYINLEQTNFDLSNPWGFTGGGQRFATSLRAGAETTDFRMSLTEPWFLGRRLSLGGELYYQDRRFLSNEFDQTNFGGAVFIRKPLGRRAYLRTEYRLEKIDVDVDSDNLTNGSLFAQEDGSFTRHAIKTSYVYDSRDSNVTPRRGHKLDLSATYAFGDVNAYTLNLRGAKHILLPYDIILNLSGDASVVDGLGDDAVPIFERTFSGGARDLRGFDFRDVGAVNDGTRDAVTQETLGGLTSAWGSVELTFPLINTVRGAVFTDFGLVSADSYDFSGTLHTDVGVGLRLNLPFGPFAVDYAIPVSTGDQDDDSGRFQFYLDYQF